MNKQEQEVLLRVPVSVHYKLKMLATMASLRSGTKVLLREKYIEALTIGADILASQNIKTQTNEHTDAR